MSPGAFAEFCGVNEVTIYRWERHMETHVNMGETTRRVIVALAGRKVVERVHLAKVAEEHGWMAAWELLFDGASMMPPRKKV